MKFSYIIIMIVVLLSSCSLEVEDKNNDFLLLADREAPMGWVYLRIYKDSTFEFESRGFRGSEVYSGKSRISKNQIFFNYYDSIPAAGSFAIYDKNAVLYTKGEYPERVMITLNKLDLTYYDTNTVLHNL